MRRLTMRSAMLRSQVFVVALGVFAVAGSLALAAESGAKPSFEALDKNSDGKVSLNEAAENDGLFVAFKSLDTNKDGVLSREEFAAYQRDKPSA
jgi:Ca2+-binding EF-hand superfamily protein